MRYKSKLEFNMFKFISCYLLLANIAACMAQPIAADMIASSIKLKAEVNKTPQEKFEQLLQLRDNNYENQRRIFFNDPQSIAYLTKKFNDPNKVTAFIAKQLYFWATQNPVEFENAENFLEFGIYAKKSIKNKTAAGWHPDEEIAEYLNSVDAANKKNISSNYLLLRALMRPSEPNVAYGIYSYFLEFPVSEPEVLIRIATELHDPGIITNLAKISLRQLDKERALQALTHERNHALRLKQEFPEELEALRVGIVKKTIDFYDLPFPIKKYHP